MKTYVTNELGDVHQVDEGGVVTPIDPSSWGWVKKGGRHDWAESRRSIDWLRALPGFIVEEGPGDRYQPGPRTRRTVWGAFIDGAAPPVAVRSRGGAAGGTLSYLDRLSEAVGLVGTRLAVMPDRSPMLIDDFVSGRTFRVTYEPPAPNRAGTGTVYVLDDGFGIKIGFTDGPVPRRIGQLQTGNPRRITSLAEVRNATIDLEGQLQDRLSQWNISGEWFARDELLALAQTAGGLEQLLRELVGVDHPIVVHPLQR